MCGGNNAPAIRHVDGVPVKHAHEDRQTLLEQFRQQDLRREHAVATLLLYGSKVVGKEA